MDIQWLMQAAVALQHWPCKRLVGNFVDGLWISPKTAHIDLAGVCLVNMRLTY